MEFLSDPNVWIAFAMLTALRNRAGHRRHHLHLDSGGRLRPELRDKARRLGLGFAMALRLLLLFSLSWVMGLTEDLFSVAGKASAGAIWCCWPGACSCSTRRHTRFLWKWRRGTEHAPAATEDAVMKAAGRSCLVYHRADCHHRHRVFAGLGVITAVGMVDQISVMVAAVVVSVGVMLVAAKPIGEFVDRHPSVKVLALAFLVTVGMALTAEAFDQEIPKG